MNGERRLEMRVIYGRLLISGVLLAAMLVFAAFGPQSGVLAPNALSRHVTQ